MKCFIFSFLLCSVAQGITLKVYGPCEDQPVFQSESVVDLQSSVGQVSVSLFDQHKIPYIGVAEGFNSIWNTPIGLDALEVVSDRLMRAYGWCYMVNGQAYDQMPDQVFLKSQSDELTWFFAYATNENNLWKDYCQPAYKIKPLPFCPKEATPTETTRQ